MTTFSANGQKNPRCVCALRQHSTRSAPAAEEVSPLLLRWQQRSHAVPESSDRPGRICGNDHSGAALFAAQSAESWIMDCNGCGAGDWSDAYSWPNSDPGGDETRCACTQRDNGVARRRSVGIHQYACSRRRVARTIDRQCNAHSHTALRTLRWPSSARPGCGLVNAQTQVIQVHKTHRR